MIYEGLASASAFAKVTGIKSFKRCHTLGYSPVSCMLLQTYNFKYLATINYTVYLSRCQIIFLGFSQQFLRETRN